MDSLFVVAMGVGTVFVGLICIVLICSLLGLILKDKGEKRPIREQAAVSPEKQHELLAVMAGAIAVSSHRDPACIKIISVKKVK